MSVASDISATRDLALSKVGRNVVNFQKMEAMLKFILKVANFSVPISGVQQHLNTQTTRLQSQPMGQLVESAAKNLHAERPAPLPDVKEIWLTYSISLSEGGSQLHEWRREMRNVVRERNNLIHRMLASWDPHSIDSCHALCEALDAQRERILRAYEHLESIVRAIRESHEELARK
jgi:hypothetical protein